MITPNELTLIRAWGITDLQLAIKTYQRAHPDPAGQPVADSSPAGLVEQRVADILAQRLNAQLAVTPLIPAAQQDLANRLDTLWANVDVAGWTAATPPPVSGADVFIGDILETLGADQPPSLIVTETLPAGVDVERGSLGPMSRENVTVHVLYVLPYEGSRQRQIESMRGGAAIANLLRTYSQDSVTLWLNGQVTAISRNIPRLASGARFIVSIVTFTCTVFVPYTPTQQ